MNRERLAYRLPGIEDEQILRDYMEEHYRHGEQSISASMGLSAMEYPVWVEQMLHNAIEPNGEWGRAFLYLCFDGGNLIGLLSIRYELSEEYHEKYGDIGYGVRPEKRRQGYADEMLRYALKVCHEQGMSEVMLGCFTDNVASMRTIQKNGGEFLWENERYHAGRKSSYYRIALLKEREER